MSLGLKGAIGGYQSDSSEGTYNLILLSLTLYI